MSRNRDLERLERELDEEWKGLGDRVAALEAKPDLVGDGVKRVRTDELHELEQELDRLTRRRALLRESYAASGSSRAVSASDLAMAAGVGAWAGDSASAGLAVGNWGR